MDSMMSIRNRILMNTPHLETISGNIASFKTDVSAKLKECKVYFELKQEGSGTPSPTNVRNITGYNSLTVNINGTDVTVDFPITVYGGYVDLVSGELVAEWVQIPSVVRNYDSRSGDVATFRMIVDGGANVYTDVKSNMFSRSITGNVVGVMVFYNDMGHGIWVKVPSNEITENTKEACQAWLDSHGTVFIGKLTTPIRYSLTPQQIKTVHGMNYIYTNVNNLNIVYWSHNGIAEEYQRVEYIVGDYTASNFDTGVPGNNDNLIFDFCFNQNMLSNYWPAFGNYASEKTNCWRIIQIPSSNGNGFYVSSNWQSSSSRQIYFNKPINNLDVITHITHTSISLTIDGETITLVPYKITGIANNNNIAIGKNNIGEGMSDPSRRTKWYYFRIHDGDQLIRDYIPCYRKSDRKAGFYDLVNHMFCPSTGEADFILPE